MTSLIFAYFAVVMFMAALNSKALGAAILCGLGLVAAGVDETKATFVFLLFIPAYVLAAFRD